MQARDTVGRSDAAAAAGDKPTEYSVTDGVLENQYGGSVKEPPLHYSSGFSICWIIGPFLR